MTAREHHVGHASAWRPGDFDSKDALCFDLAPPAISVPLKPAWHSFVTEMQRVSQVSTNMDLSSARLQMTCSPGLRSFVKGEVFLS